jgi:hypothetical protein
MRLQVQNHGSIFLLQPLDGPVHDWLREHAPPEAQTLGRALAVEPRYVELWINHAIEFGIDVEVV